MEFGQKLVPLNKWDIIKILIITLIVIASIIAVFWGLYIPEGVVMIYGYDDRDGNYTIECFNYTKETVERYSLNKDGYDKLLSEDGNFYKLYSRGVAREKIFNKNR